jgi:probable HAF family extracellular repeat protein
MDLGTLGGSTSRAAGVNDSGQVVGQSLFSGTGFHGFLYSGGVLYDLNNLIGPSSGFTITNGTGITDSGTILAYGVVASNGQTHALLLTPQASSATPEPATSSLVGSGVLLFFALGTRKRRR